MMKNILLVRDATPQDVNDIFELLQEYAAQNVVLPRSKEDIMFFLNNFVVAEAEGKICGCAALRDYGNDLLEIRSLVVSTKLQGKGIGKALIEAIREKLKTQQRSCRIFALTLRPGFFTALGFEEVPKSIFPEKIWSDCIKCEKRSCCDEIAVSLELDGR